MDEFTRQALAEHARRRRTRRRLVWLHATVWAAVNLLLLAIWLVTGAGFPWFVFPLLGWLTALTTHAASVHLLRGPDDALLLQEGRRRAELS